MALSPTVFVAFLGGVLPALLWLAFWLFEDKYEPEPKRYIFMTFLLGMAGVFVALKLEEFIIPYIDPGFLLTMQASPLLLASWAVIEELIKLAAAYFALRAWVFDEPVDAIIYTVTAALGFAAMENAFFLMGTLESEGALRAVITGDLRFLGATLLHTLTSATIGVALALSYYKQVGLRRLTALAGVILAITLHTLFNFFILGSGGGATFWIFFCIWIGIIAVLLLVERIKLPARDYRSL